MGFRIPLVRFSQHRQTVGRPRRVFFAVAVSLLLLGISSFDSVHIHNWSGSQQNTPVAPHHCLLCLAAHLPMTVHVSPMPPRVAFSRRAPVAAVEPGSYDSVITFSLYTRPPPQV